MIKYSMGVDAGGYDGYSFLLCVMHRDNEAVVIDHMLKTSDEKEFKAEVERVAKYYSIPADEIMYEK
jgi:hypothetical protein